jgi:gluconate:H+ symporter, GntP family
MSTLWMFSLLLGSVGLIVWCTARWRMNPFLVLFLIALLLGLVSGMPLDKIVDTLKDGFGETMKKIGLVIILGTVLGVLLERSGATLRMANYILGKVGENRAPAALSITGFLVGLPIFCDSGFIILNGLKQSLVRRTSFGMPLMTMCLATSLYGVHCLVPPHPGIAAAGATLGADLGMVMLLGIGISVPLTLLGYFWALRFGPKVAGEEVPIDPDPIATESRPLPAVWRSFLPVALPIFLIGLKSLAFLGIAADAPKNGWLKFLSLIGDPIIALLCAIGLAVLLLPRANDRKSIQKWFGEGVEKAGPILAIIAGGGTFGAMLKAADLSTALAASIAEWHLGLFFPFLLALILKTAQGSSTVAAITAASIVAPALPGLGLDSEWGRALAVLSLGAGSMVISHANDAYFWVISTFSNLRTDVLFRLYTPVTAVMGIVAQLLIWGLFLLG